MARAVHGPKWIDKWSQNTSDCVIALSEQKMLNNQAAPVQDAMESACRLYIERVKPYRAIRAKQSRGGELGARRAAANRSKKGRKK